MVGKSGVGKFAQSSLNGTLEVQRGEGLQQAALFVVRDAAIALIEVLRPADRVHGILRQRVVPDRDGNLEESLQAVNFAVDRSRCDGIDSLIDEILDVHRRDFRQRLVNPSQLAAAAAHLKLAHPRGETAPAPLFAIFLEQFEADRPAIGEPALQRIGEHLMALVFWRFLEQVAHHQFSEADFERCRVVDE